MWNATRHALVVAGGVCLLITRIAGSQAPQLLPVDEAVSRPDFCSFRAQLLRAVARHDVRAVLAVVHPDIKNTFGGDDGIAAFRDLWRLDESDSKLWDELGVVLALGGSFEDRDTFVARTRSPGGPGSSTGSSTSSSYDPTFAFAPSLTWTRPLSRD